MPSCFDPEFPLVDTGPHRKSLLCLVDDSHLLYCDPKNRLHYIDPVDWSSHPLRVSPPAGRPGDGALPFDVRDLVVSVVGTAVLAVGARAVAVVGLPKFQSVKADESNACSAAPLFDRHFQLDSTLYVVAARWHPLSDSHVAVLLSDNRLHLFNAQRSAQEPEQTLHLCATPYGLHNRQDAHPNRAPVLSAGRGGRGSSSPLHCGEPGQKIVGFAFGAGGGWGAFMILYVSKTGDVYSVGPVTPFHCRMPRALFEELEFHDNGRCRVRSVATLSWPLAARPHARVMQRREGLIAGGGGMRCAIFRNFSQFRNCPAIPVCLSPSHARWCRVCPLCRGAAL